MSLENTNTNSNGLEKFLQICINTLDQMAPRKKNAYVVTIRHFLIKNYLAQTKKEHNSKSVISKKDISKKRVLY